MNAEDCSLQQSIFGYRRSNWFLLERRPTWFALVLLCLASLKAQTNQNAAPVTGSTSHIMELLDGSYLHGGIQNLSAENGLDWRHPLATNPIRFSLDNLSR